MDKAKLTRKEIYKRLTTAVDHPLSGDEKAMARSLVEAVRHHYGLPARVKVTKLPLPVGPEQVRAFRKAMGYSQAQCAWALDVKPETVKKWEQGANPVSGPAAQWMRAAQKDAKAVEALLSALMG